MKNNRWSYFIMLLLFVTISCDNNENIGTRDEQVPITLYASIGEATRAFTPPDRQDTLIYKDETTYIWLDEYATGEPYLGAWVNISDGAGHLTSADGGTRYYPGGNHSVSIYGLHGNFSITQGAIRQTEYTHSVLADQSQRDPIDKISRAYLKSDLLYAHIPYQKSTSATHLKFSHLLCKIEVCMQPYGMVSADSLKDAIVTLENILPDATVQMSDGSIEVGGTPTSIRIPFDTIPRTATSFAGATYAEAIIPPQTITKEVFIKVTLPNNNNQEFYYVPDVPIELKAGKVYRFELSIKHLKQLPPDVDPWEFRPVDESNAHWSFDLINPVPWVHDWVGETRNKDLHLKE